MKLITKLIEMSVVHSTIKAETAVDLVLSA